MEEYEFDAENFYVAIPDFEGYLINAKGNIISLGRVVEFKRKGEPYTRTVPESVVKVNLGYDFPTVVLNKEGKRYTKSLAHLIAASFCKGYKSLGYHDGNPFNICWDNLDIKQ